MKLTPGNILARKIELRDSSFPFLPIHLPNFHSSLPLVVLGTLDA